MKIYEYLIKEGPRRTTSIIRTPFLNQEFEIIYDLLWPGKPKTSREIYEIIEENADIWKRSSRSLFMILTRMHVLVHGMVPEGLDPDNTWYNQKTRRLLAFVKEKGFDVEDNIDNAEKMSGIDFNFASPKDDLRSAVLDKIKALESGINAQVEQIKQNPKFSWLTTEELVSTMTTNLIREINNMQEYKVKPMKLIQLELQNSLRSLIREHENVVKQKQLKLQAKKRKKEIEDRRFGSAWKGKH